MRNLMGAGFAAAFLLVGSGVCFAQDTVRLGGPAAVNDMQGDTDLVRGGGGHGGGGGGHGGYGGGHGYGGYGGRGYGYGGYGGRGYGYGGYGYGRGYGYGGYGWGGYGYGFGGYGGGFYPYYTSYYPYPVYQPYYYTPVYYNYPIVGQAAPTVTLQANSYSLSPAYSQPMPGQQYSQPMPAPAGNGTFPYDGGPRAPVPMPAPGAEINPANDRGIVPLDGKLVSIPNETTAGFSPVGLPPVQPRTKTPTTPATNIAPATKTTTPAPRIIYPAYGER